MRTITDDDASRKRSRPRDEIIFMHERRTSTGRETEDALPIDSVTPTLRIRNMS